MADCGGDVPNNAAACTLAEAGCATLDDRVRNLSFARKGKTNEASDKVWCRSVTISELLARGTSRLQAHLVALGKKQIKKASGTRSAVRQAGALSRFMPLSLLCDSAASLCLDR